MTVAITNFRVILLLYICNFAGQVEGQDAQYVLLVRNKDFFNVVPVSQWYTFKAKAKFTPLSLEEGCLNYLLSLHFQLNSK